MTPYRLAPWAAVACAALAVASPAASHHSFAMYDAAKSVTIVGAVKEFQWTNPHPILWVYADPIKAAPAALWSVELSSSPGPLSRMGWTKHSLNPGDRVAVDISPLRDGGLSGALKRVTLLATGQVLTTTAPIPAASK
jgi:hypothetical protein